MPAIEGSFWLYRRAVTAPMDLPQSPIVELGNRPRKYSTATPRSFTSCAPSVTYSPPDLPDPCMEACTSLLADAIDPVYDHPRRSSTAPHRAFTSCTPRFMYSAQTSQIPAWKLHFGALQQLLRLCLSETKEHCVHLSVHSDACKRRSSATVRHTRETQMDLLYHADRDLSVILV